MRKLAKITEGIIGQPIFTIFKKVNEMKRSGRKVYHFELDDSHFQSHLRIREATKDALDRHETHYVEHVGILELRMAIADHAEEHLRFRPGLNQIAVMPANAVIVFVIRCVTNPGDEIVFSGPGFSPYRALASYDGVKWVGVLKKEEDAFHLGLEEIAKRITDKTRLLIINTPNNPTGVYSVKKRWRRFIRLPKKGIFSF
jgi:aspartate/methionine/tyrosine aminotransferase